MSESDFSTRPNKVWVMSERDLDFDSLHVWTHMTPTISTFKADMKATFVTLICPSVWKVLYKWNSLDSLKIKPNQQIQLKARWFLVTLTIQITVSRFIQYAVWDCVIVSDQASHLGRSGPIPEFFAHSYRWSQDIPGTAHRSHASHGRRCHSSDHVGYSIWSWKGCLYQTGNSSSSVNLNACENCVLAWAKTWN